MAFSFALKFGGLEQRAKRCSQQHEMLLREGPHGAFWGCSQFPVCREKVQLTAEERKVLARDRCA